MIDFQKLAEPFPPDAISWRVGSTTGDKTKGMALAFVDARDVMDRLDAVCSPAGWQCRYSHANGKTVCDISIKCGDEWVSKADGAGDTDYEAEKGALSDAFKRAAVRWGVGRYLYTLPNPWVAIEPAGAKSFRIKAEEHPKLRALLSGQAPKLAPQQKPDKAASATPAVLSLAQRAGILGDHMRACTDQVELKAVWDRGAKLCAELDAKDPERLAELIRLHDGLEADLPARKAA